MVGIWQKASNDTTTICEIKQDGNVFLETDYFIVDDKKSAYSYWGYS